MRLFLFLLAGLSSLATARRLPPIYWNSTNSIFDISNTDHIFGVSIGDQVSIFCPEPGVDYEYSMLYLVSEEEYQHCTVFPSSRPLGKCMNNVETASLSIVFRKYSPIPGGLEFAPGKTYYVITTSTGSRDGADNMKGGLCDSAQMKVKFEVEGGSKASRHEERAFNPKFAARTGPSSSSDSLPVITGATADDAQLMYIIHDGSETTDDDASSSLLSLFPTAIVAVVVLLRG